MGEGGCVLTANLALARIVESLRDWGRDCWCEPGESGKCLKRFEYQMGTLPVGYDHKYIFSHVGYNLKATDLEPPWASANWPSWTSSARRAAATGGGCATGWRTYPTWCCPRPPRAATRAGSASS